MPRSQKGRRRKRATRANKSANKQAVFPRYLTGRNDDDINLWIAQRLVNLRGSRKIEEVAKHASVTPAQIEELETGKFTLNLGCLHDILAKGYGKNLLAILQECYEMFRTRFDPDGDRPFLRD